MSDETAKAAAIGMIGLGAMGSGVARNLAKSGRPLIVWNRSPGPAKALEREGARTAGKPADVFAGAEVVFSMLADDQAIEQAIVASGALDAARAGAIHVNLATISVALAERLDAIHRERGLAYVAAPVLGRPDAAAAAGLAMLAAGDPKAVEKVRPLLELLSRRIFPVGAHAAQANVIKLACNFALASMIETLGEAGALAQANGVEPATVFEVMTETLFAAPAYRIYAELIREKRFSPAGFAMPLGLKDVRLAMQAAEAKNAAMPIASVLRDRLLTAIAGGGGALDWSAMAMGAFRDAGLPT